MGFPGRFGISSAWRGSAYPPVRRHPARQGADAAVFEGPLGPGGDLDHLLAVGGHRGAFLAILSEMDDPEEDFWLRLAVSRTAHSGTLASIFPRNEPTLESPGF